MTMTEPITWAGTARNFAHGVGQIFFQPNPATGLLTLAGIAVWSVPMALMTALGVAVATASARLVGVSTAQGLQGYCGALVGAAAWTTFAHPWPAFLATVLGGAACPAVTKGLDLALTLGGTARAGLPVLTAPFCVVSSLLVLLNQAIIPPAAPAPPAGLEGPPLLLLLQGILAGISQVVLVESWLGGLLMLVGLCLAGWRVGLAAVLGSSLGAATALATGTHVGTVAHGLAGFSPTLTAIALAVVFLKPGWPAWLAAAVGSVVTVGAQALLGLTPAPVFTWPFIVTTWLALLVLRRQRR